MTSHKDAPKSQKRAKGAAEPPTPFDGPEFPVSAKAKASAKATRKSTQAKKAPKGGVKAKKPFGMLKTDRSNKKAEVIAMIKRAKGVTPDGPPSYSCIEGHPK